MVDYIVHDAAMAWVKAQEHKVSPTSRIVEIGGRNANYGTVRPLWPFAKSYVAVDLYEGEGVDWVGDFADYWPEGDVDLVIATEVFEHYERWDELIVHSSQILGHEGAMLITAAGPSRAPHSAIDGSRPLPEGEWYRNIDPVDLYEALYPYFRHIEVDTARGEPLGLYPNLFSNWPIGDVYAYARRP